MTLKEFYEFADKHRLPLDYELRIQAFGGIARGKNIKQAVVGFDWNMKSVVLVPTLPLEVKGSGIASRLSSLADQIRRARESDDCPKARTEDWLVGLRDGYDHILTMIAIEIERIKS